VKSVLLRSLLVAAGVVLAAGCHHCCRRPQCADAPAVAGPLPPPPPGAVAGPPSGSPFLPQTAQAPPAPAPVEVLPQQQSEFSPLPAAPDDLSWRPAPGSLPRVQLRAPEPITPGKPEERARLYPPEVEEKVTPAPKKPPVVTEDTSPPPALPSGIPQYAVVKDRLISTGRRPMLEDGLDWLKENGYRTVLNVRRPGEDDTTDRKEAEKRGLKYVRLEVSPATLTNKVVEEFSRIVRDADGYPLFVYDQDGSLAGGLWYVYFRTTEGMDEEAARVRAAAVGLREDRDSHREMWVAIRNLLAKPAAP
jgi:protein tyrosine phosphatase (PTP) superfamily phosphohydrolase (DUF442 family)